MPGSVEVFVGAEEDSEKRARKGERSRLLRRTCIIAGCVELEMKYGRNVKDAKEGLEYIFAGSYFNKRPRLDPLN